MSGNFIDTNVLVYLFDETNDRKRAISEELIGQALSEGSAVISFQVVQETLNVITRKLAVPVDTADALAFLDQILVPLWKINPSTALYDRGLSVSARYSYSFYDALVIAAALQAGCRALVSEDLQHGQLVEGLRIENPFREDGH